MTDMRARRRSRYMVKGAEQVTIRSHYVLCPS